MLNRIERKQKKSINESDVPFTGINGEQKVMLKSNTVSNPLRDSHKGDRIFTGMLLYD